MPQENKLKSAPRGRRLQKKREREEAAIDDDATSKKQKPNGDEVNDLNAVDLADAFGGQNPFENGPRVEEETGGAEEDRPFYGMLEDEEQEYFRHADELLELNDFPSDEDRSLFLANVYREAEGKELKIANSQSCSRLMERLILLSTVAQKKKLFEAFSGNFLHLIQHRFASHCCERLFIHSAPAVTQELLGADVPEEKTAAESTGDAPEEQGSKESMEELFLLTLNELEGQMSYLLTDRFASHTLRVLLTVLSGRPLESSSVNSLLKSKKKEDVSVTGFDSKADDLVLKERVVPDSFSFAIGKIIADVATELDTTTIRVLATHTTGNPSLQLLLELDFSRREKGKKDDTTTQTSIIKKLLPDDLGDAESESIRFVNGLMYDPIGSRLLETIVRCAPGKLFKQLYKSVFQERLGSLARNEIASYVIIRVLERMSRQDLEAAVALIKPEIPSLVSRSRTAVLRSLLERCHVRNDTESITTLTNAIEAAYDADAATLLLKMVQIDPEEATKAHDATAPASKPGSNQLHGSLLAQSMLSIPGRPTTLIRSSLLAVSPDVLLYLGNNTVTSHIIQAAFKNLPAPPTSADAIFCRKLINNIIPNLRELALSNSGSHVLDVILNVTVSSPVLFFITERIAKALLEHEEALRDSRPGRLVWRNWRCELYGRDREAWVRKIKSHSTHWNSEVGKPAGQKRVESVQKLTKVEPQNPGEKGSNQNKPFKQKHHNARSQQQGKTAIQLARERFAAKQNGSSGSNNAPLGNRFQKKANTGKA